MIRLLVHYSGRVQGVGFRATAASLAPEHAVEGTVRNLPDGRVELVAQGDPARVEAFLAAIDRAMGPRIHGVSRESRPPIEPSGEFRVVA